MKKPSDVSPLDLHLGYWLRLVSNHVSHSFKRKLEDSAVTVAEWVALRKLLELGPVSPSQLAEALGMTRGAISKLDERLASKGLIDIRQHETDARQQILALTTRGYALVPRLAALADDNDAHFFGALTKAEQASLRALLAKLVRSHKLRGTPID
jgi:DNA-binding MarR family transcriptional regulator